MKRKGLSNFVVVVIILAIVVSGVRVVNANKFLNIYVDAFKGYNTRTYSRYVDLTEEQVESDFNDEIIDYLISHVTSKELEISKNTLKNLNESVKDFRTDIIDISVIEVDESLLEARIYVTKTDLFSEFLHILNKDISNNLEDAEYGDNFATSLTEAIEKTKAKGKYELTIKINYDRETKMYSISDKYFNEILAIITGL